MTALLESVLQKKQKANENITEIEETKSELVDRKNHIESKIKRLERKEVDDKITGSLRKLSDISDAIADIQNAVNMVWKRTKQIEEELKNALLMPSESQSLPENLPR